MSTYCRASTTRFGRAFGLLALAVLAGLLAAGAVARKGKGTMHLSARMRSESYLHGQSILVDCVLEHTGPSPIHMPDPELNDGETRYVLQGPGNAPPRTLTGADYNALRNRGLSPLSEYTDQPARFRIPWTRDLLAYTPPLGVGEYRLTVRFGVDGESAESAPVTFRVEPARPEGASFGWLPLVGPRGSWEGAWIHRGARGRELMYQSAYSESPQVVESGQVMGEAGPGATRPVVALRMRNPIDVAWRWLVWLEDQQAHGVQVPTISGGVHQGRLEGRLEEAHPWIVWRPIQTGEDGLILVVAGERGGKPVLHEYRCDATGHLKSGPVLELPHAIREGDALRVAREATGERAAIFVADRSAPGRTRVLAHEVGPQAPGGWAPCLDAPGELAAWSSEDAGDGEPGITVLLRDGAHYTCGSFPLDTARPWRRESLHSVIQEDGRAARPFAEPHPRETAIASGLRGESPLILIFDAQDHLWASGPGTPVTLRPVPLPAFVHGAAHPVPCVTFKGRRFAGFVENEVGWRWERVPRSSPATPNPPAPESMRPDAPSGR